MKIISSSSLTEKQICDLESLKTICTEADNIVFGLFVEPDLNEYRDMPCFFMIYNNDNTELLAFLSLFVPGDCTAEVSACTHPAHRQKGYFHALYSKALEIALQFDINTLVFATAPKQQAALAILAKYSAELDNTEYLLQYENPAPIAADTRATDLTTEALSHTDSALCRSYMLTPASENEFNTHIDIFAAAFGYSREAAARFIKDIFTFDSDIRAFSFTDTSTGSVIGCCYVEMDNSRIMPFGICIRPDMQGQKLGQHMLTILINDFLLQYKKPIMLQVSGSNKNALHIYKKLGFKTASQIDYHSINISI